MSAGGAMVQLGKGLAKDLRLLALVLLAAIFPTPNLCSSPTCLSLSAAK